MYLTPEVKKDLFKEYGKSEFDTGSAEGQVALFTYRITHLTGHLKAMQKITLLAVRLFCLLVKEDVYLNI